MICNRYEGRATVITRNRDDNEWPLGGSRRQDRH